MLSLSVLLLAGHLQTVIAADSQPADLGRMVAASAKAEKSKDYAAAITAMKTFQQRGGDPFLYSLRLGWLHYQARDYADSARAYQQAVALKPTSLNALLGVLNAVEALRDVRKTSQAAAAVLQVEPSNYRALMVVAGMKFTQKDYREAAAGYQRVLAYFPDDPDALSGAAWSAMRAGDKPGALAGFKLLLGMNPDYPKAAEGFRLAAGMAG